MFRTEHVGHLLGPMANSFWGNGWQRSSLRWGPGSAARWGSMGLPHTQTPGRRYLPVRHRAQVPNHATHSGAPRAPGPPLPPPPLPEALLLSRVQLLQSVAEEASEDVGRAPHLSWALSSGASVSFEVI